METKANFALIGAFVIVSLIAILGFIFFMANSEFRRDFAEYEILFEVLEVLSGTQRATFRDISRAVSQKASVKMQTTPSTDIQAAGRSDAQRLIFAVVEDFRRTLVLSFV